MGDSFSEKNGCGQEKKIFARPELTGYAVRIIIAKKIGNRGLNFRETLMIA